MPDIAKHTGSRTLLRKAIVHKQQQKTKRITKCVAENKTRGLGTHFFKRNVRKLNYKKNI